MANVPLAVEVVTLTTAATTTEGPIIRRLPNGLPSLRRRRLYVHPRGVHNHGPPHHDTGWWGHGRVIVRHPAGSGPHDGTNTKASNLLLDLVSGDNVDKKIKNVGAGDGGGDIVLLEGAALVLLGVEPGPDGELEDEELARFGEEYGSLGGDHADVLVGLHDLLDAG